MLSQLQLDHFKLEELIVQTNPDAESVSEENYVFEEINFDLKKHVEDKRAHWTRLVIEWGGDEKARFRRVRIVLSGYFSFSEEVDDNFADKARLNELAILYGVARGILATIPATSEVAGFLLPAVNFIEVAKRKTEASEQAAKKLKKRKRTTTKKKSSKKGTKRTKKERKTS